VGPVSKADDQHGGRGIECISSGQEVTPRLQGLLLTPLGAEGSRTAARFESMNAEDGACIKRMLFSRGYTGELWRVSFMTWQILEKVNPGAPLFLLFEDGCLKRLSVKGMKMTTTGKAGTCGLVLERHEKVSLPYVSRFLCLSAALLPS
jgi:hypothetical protein